MKRIRYLTLLLSMLFSIGALAQNDDDFDPANPTEPGGPITSKVLLTLEANPEEGGSVSGGGRYEPGKQVTLRATERTGFNFVNWTRKDGTVVSTSASFTYTVGNTKETLTANFSFNPVDPGNPGEIEQNVKHRLTLIAEEGGTVTGSGRYLPGVAVTAYATANSQFEFVGWYDNNGQRVSTSQSYNLTMPASHVTLTARFNFVPDNPIEPGKIPIYHYHQLTLNTEGEGSVWADAYKLEEGQSVMVNANPSKSFDFVGWYQGGILISESASFSFTMGSENAELTARFVFNPNTPDEPQQIKEKQYAFYLMNVVGKPDVKVNIPVYFITREEARDISFRLSFPQSMVPDLTQYTLYDDASDYAVTFEATDAEEGRRAYMVTLTGGQLPVGDVALLTFSLTIPSDAETAMAYPITINQASITKVDESSVTASIRNGRISVYKNGDTNGDNEVNVVDVANTISKILGETPDDFIIEAADTNDDEGIDVVDVAETIDIVLGNSGNSQSTPQGNNPD